MHLVEPLGFTIDDRHLKRAGVDYWHLVDVRVHANWAQLRETLGGAGAFHFFTAKGGACYSDVGYGAQDVLVFGRESVGLPPEILEEHRSDWRFIPMAPGVRSLNLSNTVAIAVYEGLRQLAFPEFPRV